MKHKVGETVRIRSQEWFDAQEKDNGGNICIADEPPIVEKMFCYAGKTATITKVNERIDVYELDIDNGEWNWSEVMFDPAYRPEDEPLSAEDAIRAMMDGETLCDEEGWAYTFNKAMGYFEVKDLGGHISGNHVFRNFLHRRPAKRKRLMTRWEILAWANSEESRGWVVRTADDITWYPLQFYGYTGVLTGFQRAKLLSDLSGIDESTIQGFEVEVKE